MIEMKMGTNRFAYEAVEKLRKLVTDIDVCLFCTLLKTNDGATCRPMGVQQIDDEGNMWFFSEVDSDKNREIEADKHVQLIFSHPGKGSYLIVNGEASIYMDKQKTRELWSALLKTWFKEGVNDPSISIIKVNTKSAFYWDANLSKMINIFKVLAYMRTGITIPMEIVKDAKI